MSVPPEWEPGLSAIRALKAGSVVLIVGASDRGKTTFVQQVARRLTLDGVKTAIADTDIGQSEIGPPGTVGVTGARREWAENPNARLTDLKPGATFFVGAFAPASVALELTVAAAQAVRFARGAGAQRILVDTTGFVSGPAARRLKVAKAQVIAPALVIGIGKPGEIDSLLTALTAATGAESLSLPVPGDVGRKSTAFRATRRMTRLAAAFEDAQETALPLRDLRTVGCTLGSGDPVSPELVRWAAESLRLPIVRAEKGENQLHLFVTGRPRAVPDAAIAPVATYFKVSSVRLVSLAHYVDALLGFQDGSGRLLGVGRFLGLDADRDEMTVSAPRTVTADRTRMVFVGRVRVPADANGHVDIRPGEL
ncbi:MAG: Clp1/GlmU family protein [Capsulimonadales bacterium]|nr:Clp1/GlmU family protein [Capsulimonadales bacterium]